MITNDTRNRATHLLLDMQKHFANGGTALSMRDVNKLLGLGSSASAQMYVNILEDWGTVRRIKGGVRTIVLAPPPPDYPPVDWRKDVRRLEP